MSYRHEMCRIRLCQQGTALYLYYNHVNIIPGASSIRNPPRGLASSRLDAQRDRLTIRSSRKYLGRMPGGLNSMKEHESGHRYRLRLIKAGDGIQKQNSAWATCFSDSDSVE